MAPEYQQGAGWVFAADLSTLASAMPAPTGHAGRPLLHRHQQIAWQVTLGDTENRASVIFSKDRTGVASWLAAPGPMGSLSFVSPDAGFAVSTILKNPTLIVDDLMNIHVAGDRRTWSHRCRQRLWWRSHCRSRWPAAARTSWKIVAEVYDPGRIQSAFTKLATDFNASSAA